MRNLDIFDTDSCCQSESLITQNRVVTLINMLGAKPDIREAMFFKCAHCGRNWFKKFGTDRFCTEVKREKNTCS